ncbi:uncharacterized protein LOC121385978 [Gigantopelta aegis]|uniref:uncharacterized protein LOC121385978 n=1 Tax=Gigantopelta aegis TaxID=1735272 RepID=UPI001B88CD2D|nr:uncharacterized protein LOC121385978 [Gigantopelta aegis]
MSQCRAYVVTVDNMLQIADQIQHNHTAVPFIKHVDMFKAKLMDRAKMETTPIPKIYADEISNLRKNHNIVPDGLLAEIPHFSAIKTILYRQQHKSLPRLSQTRQDINLGEWTCTEGGDPFVHRVEGGDLILIFTTDKNLELCDADVVLSDGTFSSAPKLFNQLYTIHAESQGHMFPLVYSLIPNRTEDTYVRTFQYLQEACHDLGFHLNPRTFQMDFERSAHNAVQTVFPTTQLRGCFFHYTQCIWRRTQKVGLATEYSENDEIQKVVRRASTLPMVPLDKIEDVWADTIADSPQGAQVTQLMDYVTNTWIEGPLSPEMWNHFGNDSHRTNNHLEGWYHKINKIVQKGHLNIFEVVGLLKREQSVMEVKMHQLDGHWRAPA